jgi:ferritin
MLSPKMLAMLNEQIKHEFLSSNIYLAMSSWCAAKGLRGSARFLEHHADEEMMHMRKIFSYINETDAQALVPALEQPPKDYGSLKEVMSKALEHEKFITGKIHALVELAQADKDFATLNFLQWYVAEQHEEEALFRTVMDIIEVAGTDGRGLYFVDKEIGKLLKKESGE